MIKIVTHDAKFHTDDVFAVATLLILLGKENCEVTRTRDEEVIKTGDYVVDVGQIYDESLNKFDHHQAGGAGERENGIPYASFGLVWKKFGEEVCGSKVISENIDKHIVQQIDAIDNGYDLFVPNISGIHPFDVNSIVSQYRLTWKEDGDWDKQFMLCVDWAMSFLKRQIKISQDIEEGKAVVLEAYNNSVDKRIIYIDEKFDLGRELVGGVLEDFPEPLYAVLYRKDSESWQVVGIGKNGTFERRKPLPEAWRAKMNKELEDATGVTGAVFCHRSGFMCVTKTKEGAIALAEKALNA